MILPSNSVAYTTYFELGEPVAHWPMSSLLSYGVGLWPIVCFSFALIDFSLKRFLSLFDCFMPAALSRFGTLGEFGTVVDSQ